MNFIKAYVAHITSWCKWCRFKQTHDYKDGNQNSRNAPTARFFREQLSILYPVQELMSPISFYRLYHSPEVIYAKELARRRKQSNHDKHQHQTKGYS